jgi:hypothetical protein
MTRAAPLSTATAHIEAAGCTCNMLPWISTTRLGEDPAR